jgi:hypothetical protein
MWCFNDAQIRSLLAFMVNPLRLVSCACATLVIALALLRPTAAWMDTGELQSVCEAALAEPVPDNPRYALCSGIVIGMLMADSLEQDRICVPHDLDTKAALRVFIARAKSEPHKDIEGTVTLFRALTEQYPCVKQ